MEKSEETILFKILRQQVVAAFLKEHSNTPVDVMLWSGQNIVQFQEDLQQKVNTTISEKWFYTYFKQYNLEKLPRIDMLNLLSKYAGYENWLHFIKQNQTAFSEKPIQQKAAPKQQKKDFKFLYVLLVFALLAGIVYAFIPKKIDYHFCFIDKDVNMPITSSLQILFLPEGESPFYTETEENGCFTYQTTEKKIRFAVQSPYYKTDTIIRYYNSKNSTENVQLSADEYALILHYFSTNNVEDWNKRRSELDKMIDDNAIIYQVFGNEQFGIDILSKEAFINKITLPTSSLRNMKILEIKRNENEIVKLKFEIKLDYE